MEIKLLLETLDKIDEGLTLKSVKAAVEIEPDAGRRAMILAKLAAENNLPGLYDPTDGTYYNVNGEKERSPDNAITQRLGSVGLVPMNAQTSMFGLWGADDVKQGAISQSFDLNWNAEVDDNIKRLNDLVKQISVNLKESKKRKKSISNALYESFFGLDEAEDFSIGSGYKGPKIGSGYDGPKLSAGGPMTSSPSLGNDTTGPTTITPPSSGGGGNKFAKEIEEMNKIIEVLTALNEKRPNQGIVAAIERAKDVIKRVNSQPAEPPKPTPGPVSPQTGPAEAPGPRANVFTDPNWARDTFPSLRADDKPRPDKPTVDPTPAVDPRIEKVKKARELLDQLKKLPRPSPVGPQVNPDNPQPQPQPGPEEDKKWPTTPDEIKAFQNGRDDPRSPGKKLNVDGIIGTHTYQALIDAGYKPPNDFNVTAYKPRRNNNRPVTPPAPSNNPIATQVSPDDAQKRREELFRRATGQNAQDVVNQSGLGRFDSGSGGNIWEESVQLEDDRILDQIRSMRV
jgi:hypothetical protein